MTNNKFPIIVIHKGNPEYLNYCLLQAKKSNFNARIILLGDNTNHKKFVEHHEITLPERAEAFKKIYKHLSPNGFEYELFCFLRWFVLEDFMKKNQLEKCLHIDSDVMLYGDVDKIEKSINTEIAFVYTSGHTCLFKSLHAVENFCNFLMDIYQNKIDIIEKKHNELISEKSDCGINDMTLFFEYKKAFPEKFTDLMEIKDKSVFDLNISQNSVAKNGQIVCDLFEMLNGMKKIVFKNNMPYIKLISSEEEVMFQTLHFQGHAKEYMKKYCLGCSSEKNGLFHKLLSILRK